ncbi:MAG: hypothetical protein Q4F28_05895 [Eubacteriales bacterium]|nr:hypothetical protein [Eubacteriales bacterium]
MCQYTDPDGKRRVVGRKTVKEMFLIEILLIP